MKHIFTKTGLVALLLSCMVCGQAQNTSIIKRNARTASTGVSVKNVNGQTSVVYKGNEVWSGRAKGKVTANAKIIDGVEYVAAFDGDKVKTPPGLARISNKNSRPAIPGG